MRDLEGQPAKPEANASRAGPQRRGRGRPVAMPAEKVLAEIRAIERRGSGLFRIHRVRGDLYAAARRRFGSWAAAVAAAGIDYGGILTRSRARSVESRRRARANGRPR